VSNLIVQRQSLKFRARTYTAFVFTPRAPIADWLMDLDATLEYLARAGFPRSKVGVVGFCMGGGLALVLACQRPDAVAAVVPAYGVIPWPDARPDYTNPALTAFEKQLHDWTLIPVGTEGYEKAEVTAGGVSTGELSSKSMESRLVPGLFFIGEVVDVTGQLGGFNFQWAWASAAAAGRAL